MPSSLLLKTVPQGLHPEDVLLLLSLRAMLVCSSVWVFFTYENFIL